MMLDDLIVKDLINGVLVLEAPVSARGLIEWGNYIDPKEYTDKMLDYAVDNGYKAVVRYVKDEEFYNKKRFDLKAKHVGLRIVKEGRYIQDLLKEVRNAR